MSRFHDLEDLLIEQLQDVYDAENQLVTALPKAIAKAHNVDLRKAFSDHLDETKEHVSRLVEVFQHLKQPVKGKRCNAMAGLIKEMDEVLESTGDPDVLDAALIAGAQRIEHYEIAAYGTLKAFAKRLDHKDAAKILDKTLDEEGAADKKLSKLAEGGIFSHSINKDATR